MLKRLPNALVWLCLVANMRPGADCSTVKCSYKLIMFPLSKDLYLDVLL